MDAVESTSVKAEKRCPKCTEVKPLSEFGRSANRKDKLQVYCLECRRDESKAYAAANSEKIRDGARAWRKKEGNREKCYARYRKWYESGKGKDTLKAWRIKNSEKLKLQNNERRTSPANRIHHSVRSRLQLTLKDKAGKASKDILGYGFDELKAHLERQFLPGMSWANYGQWHIDHIIPLSSFKIDSVEHPDIKRAWGLANLRPLWAKDNLHKRSKILFLL